MVIDKNPSFGEEKRYEDNARKVADMLWRVSGGDLSNIPSSYMEYLEFEYPDGSISMLNSLDKVDFPKGTPYEEFAEVVERLIRVDPSEWPPVDSIVSIQKDKLLYEVEPEVSDFSEMDWDFADPKDMSSKMELFFKKVISSVYTDGVTSVTDSKGNPPNAQNNYLMAADGKSFSGIFFDAPSGEEPKKFPFSITEGKSGNWQIKY